MKYFRGISVPEIVETPDDLMKHSYPATDRSIHVVETPIVETPIVETLDIQPDPLRAKKPKAKKPKAKTLSDSVREEIDAEILTLSDLSDIAEVLLS